MIISNKVMSSSVCSLSLKWSDISNWFGPTVIQLILICNRSRFLCQLQPPYIFTADPCSTWMFCWHLTWCFVKSIMAGAQNCPVLLLLLLVLCSSASSQDFQRTQIFIRYESLPGENVFLRGGSVPKYNMPVLGGLNFAILALNKG